MENKPGLAFVDSATNENLLWDPASATFRPFPITLDRAAARCVWGGQVLFCEDDNDSIPGYPLDGVQAYDFSQAVTQATWALQGNGAPQGLVEASGDAAVLAPPGTGEIRHLSFASSGTALQSSVVAGSSRDAHPVVGDNYVFYQEKDSTNGVWYLKAWEVATAATTSATLAEAATPTDVVYDLVFTETAGEPSSRDAGFLWNPISLPFDAPSQGCAGYHDMKVGLSNAGHTGFPASDFVVVRASGCAGGDKLIAFNSLSSYNRAFDVGTISSTNPEFAVYEDQIAWIDPLGDLRWVRADMGQLAVLTNESEPNDTILIPNALMPSWFGQGIAGNADVDYWSFEGEAGKHYDVMTSTQSPREWCQSYPAGDTYITVFDPQGYELFSVDDGNGYCAAADFIAASDGTYYVAVTASPNHTTTYTTGTYYLTVDVL
ncbi:PPC domain-containing protein [Vulgatibacter sp.]|uniref:PPC domain-containing protein n=1 Tax=Vulgatibacter sp. TaxID=1971226 RepID=UPI0035673548